MVKVLEINPSEENLNFSCLEGMVERRYDSRRGNRLILYCPEGRNRTSVLKLEEGKLTTSGGTSYLHEM